jgi:hypothetical protein
VGAQGVGRADTRGRSGSERDGDTGRRRGGRGKWMLRWLHKAHAAPQAPGRDAVRGTARRARGTARRNAPAMVSSMSGSMPWSAGTWMPMKRCMLAPDVSTRISCRACVRVCVCVCEQCGLSVPRRGWRCIA